MVTSTRYSTDRHDKPDRLIGVSVDSTSRVQAEVSLHESERRFRAIFNGTFQFGLLTIERMVLEVNQTALDFGGLQSQNVVGRPYWKIWWTISEETQRQLKAAIALAARGEFVRYEVDVINAEQTVKTIDFSLKPLTDEIGKVVLLIFEGLDITDLKQAQTALQEAKQQLEIPLAERSIALQQRNGQLLSEIGDRQTVKDQLRQSQQMLQLIINTIPQCVFWKDRNSVFLGFNPNYARIAAGFDRPEEIVGNTREVIADVGTITNISEQQVVLCERKLAEEALLVSQQHLQYLLSSSPAGIHTCKSFGDFNSTFISENVVAITGHQAWEILEDPGFWDSHLHPVLEFFYRAINVGNILGTGLRMGIVKKLINIYQGERFVTTTLGFCTKFVVIL
ncbi:PAS domain S-box protein [Nostoc sp.]|uniref:PAS domain S-box protein n=1 Tax=Nostoc sp. TaxID=1180 RepID=UPI002FFB56A9